MVAFSKEYRDQLKSWNGYDGNRHSKLDPNWPVRARFWGGLIPLLKGIKSVAEIGGGNGDNLQAIDWYLKTKPSLLNIDISKQVLKESERRYPHIQTALGLATDIPLDDESVDLSVACGILLHIPPVELNKAIRELFRVSKKYVIIIEYYSESIEKKKWINYDVPYWSRNYEPIIERLRIPFKLKLNVPIASKNIFMNGEERETIQRGYFYER